MCAISFTSGLKPACKFLRFVMLSGLLLASSSLVLAQDGHDHNAPRPLFRHRVKPPARGSAKATARKGLPPWTHDRCRRWLRPPA